jgi:hypothetical protein
MIAAPETKLSKILAHHIGDCTADIDVIEGRHDSQMSSVVVRAVDPTQDAHVVNMLDEADEIQDNSPRVRR